MWIHLCLCLFRLCLPDPCPPGPQIVASRKYANEEVTINEYTLKMKLTIINLQPDDFTSYKCTAKNSLGEVEGSIKLYGKRRRPPPRRLQASRSV